jgi:hypothetical protein
MNKGCIRQLSHSTPLALKLKHSCHFQIVDAFDKAIEIFKKNTDKKNEVPETAVVTEISPPASTTTTTTRPQENTTVEEFIENSLPLKEKNPRV